MEFISIFFIIMSLIVLLYLAYMIKTQKSLPILLELFFLGSYLLVILIFLFPNFLKILEKTLGINSAINFFVYLSIFSSYFLLYLLYQSKEKQRQEITKLVREIAYLKKDLEPKNKPKQTKNPNSSQK